MTTAPVFVVGPGRLDDPELVLDGAEGRHAARVRRVTVGEELDLVDGAGTRARCVVRAVNGDSLAVTVLARGVEPPPAPRVVVVQALAKGDRGELAVEVLTEIGVDEIVPWQAARCVVQWRGDRGARSLDRWRSTARESAKQSRRARFPVVTGLASTREVGDRLRAASCGLVLHEAAGAPLRSAALPPSGEVVLVVGPEGGIDDAELAAFGQAGASAVLLGPTVLRTSTAGVAAAAVVLAACRW